MSNKNNLYVSRLNTILEEVDTNINQYNTYYSQYLTEQSNNCKSNQCNNLLTLMEDINSHLLNISLEAQTIVKSLKNMDFNNKYKFNADMLKLENIYNKVNKEKEIIKKLKDDILNLDTMNENSIDEKKKNITLTIIKSSICILLLLLTSYFLINKNKINLILTIIIISILVFNIFNLDYNVGTDNKSSINYDKNSDKNSDIDNKNLIICNPNYSLAGPYIGSKPTSYQTYNLDDGTIIVGGISFGVGSNNYYKMATLGIPKGYTNKLAGYLHYSRNPTIPLFSDYSNFKNFINSGIVSNTNIDSGSLISIGGNPGFSNPGYIATCGNSSNSLPYCNCN